MRSFFHRLARWLARKTAPATVRDGSPERPSFVDAYRRLRTPSGHDLLAELKNTAYACATLNATLSYGVPPAPERSRTGRTAEAVAPPARAFSRFRRSARTAP